MPINFLEDLRQILIAELEAMNFAKPTRGMSVDAAGVMYHMAAKRYIDTRHRRVIEGEDYRAPQKFKGVLHTIRQMFERGDNMNPYLSPSPHGAQYSRFYDEGGNHLHLSLDLDKKTGRVVKPPAEILLVGIQGPTVYFIGVTKANDWKLPPISATSSDARAYLSDGTSKEAHKKYERMKKLTLKWEAHITANLDRIRSDGAAKGHKIPRSCTFHMRVENWWGQPFAIEPVSGYTVSSVDEGVATP